MCLLSLAGTLPHQMLTSAIFSELTLQVLGQSFPEGLLCRSSSGPNLPFVPHESLFTDAHHTPLPPNP